jgi:hypothetical protein
MAGEAELVKASLPFCRMSRIRVTRGAAASTASANRQLCRRRSKTPTSFTPRAVFAEVAVFTASARSFIEQFDVSTPG